jgi:ABC-2 type transport system permease protein
MNVYLAGAKSGAKRALGSPGELLVRTGFYVVILVVFAALWRAAVNANDGMLAEYDYRALLWYVAGAEAAVIATKPRLIEDIGWDIGDGTISIEMLRPVSLVGFRMAVVLGEALVRLVATILAGGLIATLFTGGPPSLAGALLAVVALPLAVAVNLAAQHLFASAAFWMNDAKGTWFLYQKLIFLLGGMLLPLELFPDGLSQVARFLPFWTMAYVPARALSGFPEPELIVVQLFWLAVLTVGAFAAFRAGERRLQVAGG